jgi:hypothetical protein
VGLGRLLWSGLRVYDGNDRMWAENIKGALREQYKTGMGNELDLSGSEWRLIAGPC